METWCIFSVEMQFLLPPAQSRAKKMEKPFKKGTVVGSVLGLQLFSDPPEFSADFVEYFFIGCIEDSA